MDECIELDSEAQENMIALFTSSGLFLSLASYLRNDSGWFTYTYYIEFSFIYLSTSKFINMITLLK